MSGMSPSRVSVAPGAPGDETVSDTRPGVVSASARRWGRVDQLAMWPRIAAAALAAASAAARLRPGPGRGSMSPSRASFLVHPSGPVWLAQAFRVSAGPGSGSTSPSWVRPRCQAPRSCWL
eukprot:13796651-Alexandrium_andersonii.AAC.1